jgi:transcriptional regulator with GAF, ATPase, and Fis domain
MAFDENEFFRQATLRICGNLDIDKAIHESLLFLRETMPVDRIHLQFVEEGQTAFRIMAIADEKEYNSADLTVPLSMEAQIELRQFMENHPVEQRSSYVLLFTDPYKQLVNRDVFDFLDEKVTSLMVLLLGAVEGKVLGGGSLWLSTRGENKFTQQHAHMLSLLREPFSIAMSNALKHRSELKLHDREFFMEATRRICGDLDIGQAMYSTLKFLNQYMPATRLFLERYDESVTATRTIARTTLEKGESVDLYTPLSPEAQEFAMGYLSFNTRRVYYIDNPHERPLATEMMRFHNISLSSLILLPLISGDQVVGSLIIGSESDDILTQDHADRILSLSEPFAIAMSNALKHRSELKLHEKDFFWEATMRICGNLEVEEGLRSTVEFLSKHMPADSIYLQRYESDVESMRLVARASVDRGETMDTLIPLSEQARAAIADLGKARQAGNLPPVIIINKSEDEPVTRYMLDSLGEPLHSVMILSLAIGDEMIGSLVLLAKGDDRYNENHARLYADLKVPFFIAMSNMMKHRSELKLHDREFFREATMRICGNLEVEEGLRSTIEFLSHYMPADRIYLEKYEVDLGSMRFIARANTEMGEIMDELIPLSEQAKASMAKMRQGNPPPVQIINNPDEEPVTRHLLKAIGEPPSSAMGLPLVIEDQFLGGLVLLAEGNDRFDEDHARLYANLMVPFFVAMSNILKHREIFQLKDLLADDNRYLHGELRKLSGDEIVGANFGLRNVMQKVQQVAPLDSPVLLLGETGVGKDVIANTVHYSSSRSEGPFVSVNCGAIPDTLIDAELFGHEKGAFTGALSQKRGRFERADKGTIFLDEIGELPLQAQVRLLRVLQSKQIERVGGVKTIPLDIRIIAATNRNLEEMVKLGQFREDLWFRLNVFPIWIPPLRERSVDIPALLQYFINIKSKELNMPAIPELSTGAVDSLMEYHWPGNVRELENIVERSIILNPEGPLSFDEFIHPDQNVSSVITDKRSHPQKLDDVIFSHIETVLARTNGRVHGPSGAADLLGMNPSTLRNRMNKLGIKYGRK